MKYICKIFLVSICLIFLLGSSQVKAKNWEGERFEANDTHLPLMKTWPEEFERAYLACNVKNANINDYEVMDTVRKDVHGYIFCYYRDNLTKEERKDKITVLEDLMKQYNKRGTNVRITDNIFYQVSVNLKENLENDDIKPGNEPRDYVSGAQESVQEAVEEEAEETFGEDDDDTVGIFPERKLGLLTDQKEETVQETSPDTIIDSADKFLTVGQEDEIDETSLKNVSNTVYNVLLGVAIALAVIIGLVLGIKFMASGAEGQAKIKEALIPYIAGCTVAFSSFGIWKLIMIILNNV